MGEFPRVLQTERRNHPRLKTALGGRYMLANLREYLCTVVDASSSGLVLAGREQGQVGETVIVYKSGWEGSRTDRPSRRRWFYDQVQRAALASDRGSGSACRTGPRRKLKRLATF